MSDFKLDSKLLQAFSRFTLRKFKFLIRTEKSPTFLFNFLISNRFGEEAQGLHVLAKSLNFRNQNPGLEKSSKNGIFEKCP